MRSASDAARQFTTFNPATGEPLERYPLLDARALNRILAGAAAAQRGWAQTSFSERAHALRTLADLLRRRASAYAELMAVEMGKPLKQGVAEAEKCAWACEFFAEHAQPWLAPQPVATDSGKSFVAFRPLGVILAIMPWNYPFWQVIRCAVPTLVAGNGVLLKHAPNVTGCALAIEKLFREAGFPTDLFRTLVIDERQAARVIRDARVRGVSLTGSVRAGRAVAKVAGAALKKVVLELGGSDPYVVLEDADVRRAAEICVAARLVNSGQSCIAAKRWIVVRAQRAAFEEAVLAKLKAQRVGDPHDPATTIGPLARADLREALHRQVRTSVEAGARCLLGGAPLASRGFYYPVTLLTEVAPDMPAYGEELFGPVAVLIEAADEREALRIANDSAYGLGAAVFTRDRARGERLAVERLEAGAAFVNQQVVSDPRLPFGGIKDSGLGRELSEFGLREFVNVKAVSVA
jgi:succinate-semialdehyde dehydrogenase/glutarate-semialdehyde dehydrogenase